MKKEIDKKGYRVLAIIWTLAAASIAAAFVRRLAEFNVPLLLLLVLSVLTAANFWRCYHRTQARDGVPDPFDDPPKFADDPVLFDDDPPLTRDPNQDPEENDHE